VVGLLKEYSPLVRNSSTYTYDHLGRVTSVVDPLGFTTSRTYDGASNTLTLTQPVTATISGTTTYTYDARGNLLTETVPIDATTTVTTVNSYNATNDLLTTSAADNDAAVKLVTKYTYDAAGHLTSTNVNCTTSGTAPPATASTCTGAGTQDAATNLLTSYAYTATDQLAYEHNPRAIVTKHVYDAWGNETSTIANCTSSGTAAPAPFDSCTAGGTQDRQTNVSSTADYDQLTTAGKAGLPTSTTDAVGTVTSYTYDALGRRLTEALPGDSSIPSLTTTTTYDELGNVLTDTASWTPLAGGSTVSRTTTRAYDLANRETSLTDPAGPQTTTSFDAAGNPVSTTAAGVTTTRVFDGLGRPTFETVGGTATTSHQYDARGNETETAGPDGVVTGRTFSYTGWLVSETVDPAGENLVSTDTYDKLGREGTVIDPGGTTTTRTYDPPGRAITVAVAGTVSTNTYDRNGNLVAIKNPDGSVSATLFDPLDRPTDAIANCTDSGTTQPAAGVACSGFGTANDTTNLRTRTYYDAAGTAIAVQDPEGTTVRTSPNVRGLARQTIANCTDTGTTPTVNPPACTGAGTHNDTTNVVTTFTYDGTGAVVGSIVAQGTGAEATSETAYDAAGRVQAAKDPRGTISRTFYDADGRVQKTVVNCTSTGTTVPTTSWETCTGAGTQDGTFNLTTTYGYDTRGNQTSVTAPNGRVTTTVYDAGDRVVSRIDNDVASPSAATDDVTTGYVYDDAGRQAAVRAPTANGSSSAVTRFLYNDDGSLQKEIRNCTDSGTTPPADPGTCTGAGTADASTNLVTEHTYDARGNKVKTVAADPSASASGTGTITTRFAHDAANRLCRVVENSTQSDATFDALADRCSTAISGTATSDVSTRYTYDVAGNTATMVDGPPDRERCDRELHLRRCRQPADRVRRDVHDHQHLRPAQPGPDGR